MSIQIFEACFIPFKIVFVLQVWGSCKEKLNQTPAHPECYKITHEKLVVNYQSKIIGRFFFSLYLKYHFSARQSWVPSTAGCVVSQQGWAGCWGSPNGWIYGLAGILGDTRQSREQRGGGRRRDPVHVTGPIFFPKMVPTSWPHSGCPCPLKISVLTLIGFLWPCWDDFSMLPIAASSPLRWMESSHSHGEAAILVSGGSAPFLHS